MPHNKCHQFSPHYLQWFSIDKEVFFILHHDNNENLAYNFVSSRACKARQLVKIVNNLVFLQKICINYFSIDRYFTIRYDFVYSKIKALHTQSHCWRVLWRFLFCNENMVKIYANIYSVFYFSVCKITLFLANI